HQGPRHRASKPRDELPPSHLWSLALIGGAYRGAGWKGTGVRVAVACYTRRSPDDARLSYCTASILLSRTTWLQCSISAWSIEFAADIDCSASGKTEKSCCSKLLTTLGSASASRSAALSFSTIGLGVAAGANIPCQNKMSVSVKPS